MTTVNVHHAKIHLSRRLERVVAGEEVVIVRAGHPGRASGADQSQGATQAGLAEGRLTDAFFEPLPADELDAWQQ